MGSKVNKTVIAVIAANDRNNYGDILLPKLLEEYANKLRRSNLDFVYFSTTSANMKMIGGNITLRMNNIPDEYCVIVAGGEVLTNNYVDVVLYQQNNRTCLFLIRLIRRFFPSLGEYICKLVINGNSIMPWYIIPHNNQIVIYNSVGGTNLNRLNRKQLEGLREVIDRATVFTVRDKMTEVEIGRKLGINTQMIPDTAVIMSRLYPLDRLITMVDKIYIELTNSDYYVIQINEYEGRQKKGMLCEAIEKLYEKYNTKCVLLPIGFAKGHDDIVPLKQINNRCSSSTMLVTAHTIYDIMYIIARARCFLGTSLHGNITAFSYGVPHTSLANGSHKATSFIGTWKTSEVINVNSVEEIINFVNNVYEKKIKSKSPDILIKKVEDHFDYIFSLLQNYNARKLDT